MKPLEFETSHSVKGYDEKKTVEMATMPKSSQFPNYRKYASEISVRQFQVLNQYCAKILCPFL